MSQMTLSQLLDSLPVSGVNNDDLASVLVGDLRLDSRQIQPGDVFVAVQGHAANGIDFVQAAFANGATAVLHDADVDASAFGRDRHRMAGIPGLAQQLPALAQARYAVGRLQLDAFVAVTGTNGKTSVAHLLAQCLEYLGKPTGLFGTLGIGRPDCLRSTGLTTADLFSNHRMVSALAADGVQCMAMEVSSHALDQGRVAGMPFSHAVFTNLSRDHLDYHGSMENYADAKSRLLCWPGLNRAIVNADDAFGMRWINEATTPTLAFGQDPLCAIKIKDSRPRSHGLRCVFGTPWGEVKVKSRLLGDFNAYNLAAIVAVLGDLGYQVGDIARALSVAEPVRGRMNQLTTAGKPVVVIDFAHTPDALEQALKALRPHCKGTLYCVFGCGGDRDRGKRPLMGRVAELLADRIVLTDDNPRTEDGDRIVDDIHGGMLHAQAARIERDRREAIRMVLDEAKSGDVVLIAGKGHEDYQEVNGVRAHFSDFEVAAEVLEVAA